MKNKYHVYFSGRDFKGEGIYNCQDGSLTILEGSKIAEESFSLRKHYQNVAKLKDKLLEDEIIVGREFIIDYQFDHPFHASAILSSYGTAGTKAWKTLDGKTIHDISVAREHTQVFRNYINNFKFEEEPEKIEEEIKDVIEDFQKEFPLDELANLPIEKYDKQGSRNTLAYMIEHGTNEVFSGSLGYNKNKIIYNDEGNQYNVIKYLNNKYPNKSVREIYQKYIESVYKFITEFDRESYVRGEIGALPENANMIRSKLLTLYRPGEILHFGSVRWLKEILDYFCLEYKNIDAIMMNIRLMDFFNEIGIDKSVPMLSHLLGNFYQEVISLPIIPSENGQFEDIFLTDELIGEIVSVLKRKKAIILQGVPGVGKTFVIDQILRNSFENLKKDSIEVIQFHQSYSYEEFVEGLRPQMDESFAVEPGIFYRTVERATEDPESVYFLIIDEINRGNMSKIFGELLMLIENDKRDDTFVRLPYSKEQFSVPSNLYLIGTMNTADRSLALVDYAMRRRFSFITLEPAYDTPKFNRFLEDEMDLPIEFIIDLNKKMIAVNQLIQERLGKDFLIGHSYFVDSKENIENKEQWYYEIVKYEVLPMIEEYFFDDEHSFNELKDLLSDRNE